MKTFLNCTAAVLLFSSTTAFARWGPFDNHDDYYGNYYGNDWSNNFVGNMMDDMTGDMNMEMSFKIKARGNGRGYSDSNAENYWYYDNSYYNYSPYAYPYDYDYYNYSPWYQAPRQ